MLLRVARPSPVPARVTLEQSLDGFRTGHGGVGERPVREIDEIRRGKARGPAKARAEFGRPFARVRHRGRRAQARGEGHEKLGAARLEGRQGRGIVGARLDGGMEEAEGRIRGEASGEECAREQGVEAVLIPANGQKRRGVVSRVVSRLHPEKARRRADNVPFGDPHRLARELAAFVSVSHQTIARGAVERERTAREGKARVAVGARARHENETARNALVREEVRRIRAEIREMGLKHVEVASRVGRFDERNRLGAVPADRDGRRVSRVRVGRSGPRPACFSRLTPRPRRESRGAARDVAVGHDDARSRAREKQEISVIRGVTLARGFYETAERRVRIEIARQLARPCGEGLVAVRGDRDPYIARAPWRALTFEKGANVPERGVIEGREGPREQDPFHVRRSLVGYCAV